MSTMMTQREYVVIAIAPGAQDEFRALEGRMGMPLVANETAEPENAWWFEATDADGGSRRLFAFEGWVRTDLGGLIGPLGTPNVRLSVGYLDISPFKAWGLGAEHIERKRPPLLRPELIDRLYRAAERRRLR